MFIKGATWAADSNGSCVPQKHISDKSYIGKMSNHPLITPFLPQQATTANFGLATNANCPSNSEGTFSMEVQLLQVTYLLQG